MVTGLKVSLFACKHVFYRPELLQRGNPMGLSFEGIEIQKWDITTDKAQRIDEKNGVICLVFMFTLGVVAIKMSKMAHFLYSQFGQNI